MQGRGLRPRKFRRRGPRDPGGLPRYARPAGRSRLRRQPGQHCGPPSHGIRATQGWIAGRAQTYIRESRVFGSVRVMRILRPCFREFADLDAGRDDERPRSQRASLRRRAGSSRRVARQPRSYSRETGHDDEGLSRGECQLVSLARLAGLGGRGWVVALFGCRHWLARRFCAALVAVSVTRLVRVAGSWRCRSIRGWRALRASDPNSRQRVARLVQHGAGVFALRAYAFHREWTVATIGPTKRS